MNPPAQPAAELALGLPVDQLLRAAAAGLAAAHCAEPRLDAELLLAAACGQSRAWLLAHGGDHLSEAQALRYREFVDRRAAHEPVAYILGHKAFYGLDLLVDRRVLIPRPETETLVEQALVWIERAAVPSGDSISRSRHASGQKAEGTTQGCAPLFRPRFVRSGEGAGGEAVLTVVDVGTGSGAIALAIAAHTSPAVRLVAADVSPDALAVARDNAAQVSLAERVTFVESDLLTAIDLPADLIVANLPYVSRAEWAALAPDISAYEPHLALDGGADGLDLYRRLLGQIQTHRAAGARQVPTAALLLEIGWQQAAGLRALVHAVFPQARLRIVQDLAGQDRVALIELPHEP